MYARLEDIDQEETESSDNDNEDNNEEVTVNRLETFSVNGLQVGDSGEDVLKLQRDLQTLGFLLNHTVTNTFDEAVKEEVVKFQYYYGLNETGVANDATMAKIAEIMDNPLRNGERHEDTIQLKINLSILGFHVSDNPTTLYGSLTEMRVREFQEANGLVVNGIADEVTLAKIDELLDQPLQANVHRADVVALKMNLATLGFYTSNDFTPSFDANTEQAVREFQRYYGLTVNGIADQKNTNIN
ncbi:MAG: peptidoglycan-binding protein [Bacillaceae bacterium]|nr:peptidoglycan-binding protein [Bacillaceae bacterium]